MKAIWTLLFLALIATTFGLALLFVPETGRTVTFWLSVGGLGLGEVLLWAAITFRGTAHGEQAGGMAQLSFFTATALYLVATASLALVALFGVLPFKVLLALHILALLGLIFMAGFAAIGTRALQGTREARE